MFGLRKIIGSLLTVVAFLVLASLAAVFYSADQTKQEEITNSPLVENTKTALSTLVGTSVGVSQSMADVNLQKNIGLGKTMVDVVSRVDWKGMAFGTSTDSSISTSSIMNITGDKDNVLSNLSQSIDNENPFVTKFVDYQKTENGAEIIFRSKTGEEHKLPLPFSFLK
jgi:hypothetical protein